MARPNEVLHVARGRVGAAVRIAPPSCMAGAQEPQCSGRSRVPRVPGSTTRSSARGNADGGHIIQSRGGQGRRDLRDRSSSRGALENDLVRSRGHGGQGGVLEGGVFSRWRQEVQKDDLVDDAGIRQQAVDVFQHVSWHHVTKGFQTTTLTSLVPRCLVKVPDQGCLSWLWSTGPIPGSAQWAVHAYRQRWLSLIHI